MAEVEEEEEDKDKIGRMGRTKAAIEITKMGLMGRWVKVVSSRGPSRTKITGEIPEEGSSNSSSSPTRSVNSSPRSKNGSRLENRFP